MASFVHNNWKGHFGISVSELCFKNALGLLINYRSNFQEEQIIIRKITVTFREERIIVQKFGMNHRAKRIIIRKIVRIKTIGVTKMRGNFVEISFQTKFLQKARNFIEIRLHYFCTILYQLSASNKFQTIEKKKKLSYIELKWNQEDSDRYMGCYLNMKLWIRCVLYVS